MASPDRSYSTSFSLFLFLTCLRINRVTKDLCLLEGKCEGDRRGSNRMRCAWLFASTPHDSLRRLKRDQLDYQAYSSVCHFNGYANVVESSVNDWTPLYPSSIILFIYALLSRFTCIRYLSATHGLYSLYKRRADRSNSKLSAVSIRVCQSFPY